MIRSLPDRYWLLLTDGVPDGVVRLNATTMHWEFVDRKSGDWVVDDHLAKVAYDPDPGESRPTSAAEALQVARSLEAAVLRWRSSVNDEHPQS